MALIAFASSAFPCRVQQNKTATMNLEIEKFIFERRQSTVTYFCCKGQVTNKRRRDARQPIPERAKMILQSELRFGLLRGAFEPNQQDADVGWRNSRNTRRLANCSRADFR